LNIQIGVSEAVLESPLHARMIGVIVRHGYAIHLQAHYLLRPHTVLETFE